MKNHNLNILFNLLFFTLSFTSSCNGQVKNDLPKDSLSKARYEPNFIPSGQPITNAADYDPYFTETKTINTSYGSQSITRNIVQDRNGHFWLASWEGIIRYDGTTFTNFTNKDSLRRYRAFSVLEDKAGNIWFGTIGAGVYRYDGHSFTNFTTKQGLVHDKVGCILEDKKGNIWFGTMGGVSRYDGHSFRNFTTEDGLANNDINSIIEDKTGKFWFGARGESCTFDGKSFTKLINNEGLAFKNIRSIIEDKNGNIWVGGQDGLNRYEPSADNAGKKSFTNITPNFVGYIFEDKKGDIWISVSEGSSYKMVLSRYDKKYLPFEQSNLTPIKKQNGQVFGILEDTKGNIWFGTENGVSYYDGKTFTNFLAN